MLPFTTYAAYTDSWMRFTRAYGEMSLHAAEVIAHRTFQMATGTMSAPEAIGMVMEKATAFAVATERAALVAARGGDVMNIASEALKPYGAKTRSNVRRLRG
ncbi:hypothetical protein [Amaricoccus solimangrovi]|uniref:Antifreeze protein n=1 Tax=Amaricoccus solimangrovi TaxID=2589815 RepID=A0A501WTC3_9RHOB|nr:hypothetical protein [Amaricoccus solimangrovi]TPE51354.1 hypothetical protein FJM51_08925 [Amaricoccus solimangrovi]